MTTLYEITPHCGEPSFCVRVRDNQEELLEVLHDMGCFDMEEVSVAYDCDLD